MNLSKEFKIGLFITVALVILYLGCNFLKERQFLAKTHTYYAIYNDTNGLTTASKVMLNGCPVGKIRSIDMMVEQDYQVRVGFSIQKNIQLTDQTIAKLVSSSILNNKIIELVLNEGKPLLNKNLLKSEVVEDFQKTFMENTLKTIQDIQTISTLLNTFIHNLADNTSRINNIFHSLEKAAQQTKETININQNALSTVTNHLFEITQALSDKEVGIRPFITKLNALAVELEKLKIKDITIKVDSILANIESSLLQTNLDQVLCNLDSLLVDIKEHPSKYVHFSLFGRCRRPKPAKFYAKKLALSEKIKK